MEYNAIHVLGEANFIYDKDIEEGVLKAYPLCSTKAKARIISIDTSKAKALPGVEAVLTAEDIPGVNNCSETAISEEILASEYVYCQGQIIAVVAAQTLEIARAATKLIEVEYEELPAIFTIEEAIEQQSFFPRGIKHERGDVDTALAEAECCLEGEFDLGGQEHWYLETNVSYASRGEGDEMLVYATTQNTSLVQQIISEFLDIGANMVTIEVRRLGGAFGGKEMHGTNIAAMAALLSWHTSKPVYFRFDRDIDQIVTGKRHPYKMKYRVGFDRQGYLKAYDMKVYSNAGHSEDISFAVLERTFYHTENAYYIPAIRFDGKMCRTNIVSNTAFRGFGGPQAILAMELVMDRIALTLKMNPVDVRRINFFSTDVDSPRHISYYGQGSFMDRSLEIMDKLVVDANYLARLKAVEEFNSNSSILRRGLGITSLKFGISFTFTTLNQAGALVHLYKDGSMQINQSGIEMGQGLFKKMAIIASRASGLSIDKILITPSTTSKVPNASPTAGSLGADLNGMAIVIAIDKLKARLSPLAERLLKAKYPTLENSEGEVVFDNNAVHWSGFEKQIISMAELCSTAHFERIGLSEIGFYKTPGLYFDHNTHQGQPFNYYVYGAALSEVEVNTLTGEIEVLRTDIMHDAGISIDQGIDKGQVEGAFLQGQGWLTTEDLRWDSKGKLLNNSPSTYKIPTMSDIPKDFRVTLLQDVPNPRAVAQSKGMGEPPFIYGNSVYQAIKAALQYGRSDEVRLAIPATNDAIVTCLS